MEIKPYLQSLGISFKSITHPAVFTCEEAEQYERELNSPGLKNLFLKSKNSPEKFYFVILPASKKLDIKYLENILKTKLRFANDFDLKEILGLTSGSVSPFGLIYDKEHITKIIIDSDVLKEDFVSFHPNINTETLELKKDDFLKFLKSLNISNQEI